MKIMEIHTGEREGDFSVEVLDPKLSAIVAAAMFAVASRAFRQMESEGGITTGSCRPHVNQDDAIALLRKP